MGDVIEIDARGHRCPIPTLKLRKAVDTNQAVDRIKLIADDPMAQIDVPHFCNQNHISIQSVEQKDNYWIFEMTLLQRSDL